MRNRNPRVTLRVGLRVERDGDSYLWRAFHHRRSIRLNPGAAEWLGSILSDTSGDRGISAVKALPNGGAVRLWAKVSLRGWFDYFDEFSDEMRIKSYRTLPKQRHLSRINHAGKTRF